MRYPWYLTIANEWKRIYFLYGGPGARRGRILAISSWSMLRCWRTHFGRGVDQVFFIKETKKLSKWCRNFDSLIFLLNKYFIAQPKISRNKRIELNSISIQILQNRRRQIWYGNQPSPAYELSIKPRDGQRHWPPHK